MNLIKYVSPHTALSVTPHKDLLSVPSSLVSVSTQTERASLIEDAAAARLTPKRKLPLDMSCDSDFQEGKLNTALAYLSDRLGGKLYNVSLCLFFYFCI